MFTPPALRVTFVVLSSRWPLALSLTISKSVALKTTASRRTMPGFASV